MSDKNKMINESKIQKLIDIIDTTFIFLQRLYIKMDDTMAQLKVKPNHQDLPPPGGWVQYRS